MMLTKLLDTHPNVLLDFDGPVCDIFAGISAQTIAGELIDLIEIHGIPVPERNNRGPHSVLAFAGQISSDLAHEVEQYLEQRELDAAMSATPTPGTTELLNHWSSTGRSIAIVSNNAPAAIERYFAQIGFDNPFPIVGRDPSDPTLMKPNTHLLVLAIKKLSATPGRAVLIGDSVTDIEAATKAGIASIGYANKPGKKESLLRYSPTAIIESMGELSPWTLEA